MNLMEGRRCWIRLNSWRQLIRWVFGSAAAWLLRCHGQRLCHASRVSKRRHQTIPRGRYEHVGPMLWRTADHHGPVARAQTKTQISPAPATASLLRKWLRGSCRRLRAPAERRAWKRKSTASSWLPRTHHCASAILPYKSTFSRLTANAGM